MVIPGKSLNELSKILDDTNDLIDIVITENQVLFKAKHLLFFSRLLEGNYSDTSDQFQQKINKCIQVITRISFYAIDRALYLHVKEKIML